MTTERRWLVLSTLLVLIGTARIASTLHIYSATSDEATHTGSGLELLQHHQYNLQIVNPPLPRLLFAALPFALGLRMDPSLDFTGQIHSVFYPRGDYVTNVVSARIGNLPFFVLACVGVWVLARKSLGDSGALVAILLFTLQPIILGYSGLVTHDTAATAGTAIALIAFDWWLGRPTPARAAVLGTAYGFAILCKFACVPDVPLACAAIYGVRLMRDSVSRRRALSACATLLVVPLTAFVTVWAGYGFTIGTFERLAPWQREFGHIGASLLRHIPPATPLPASHFFTGIGDLLRLDREGMASYLFGRVTTDGFWWYFPAAIALKTTLGFLALFALGFLFAMRQPKLRWPFLEWSAAAAAIIVYAFKTRLDLGIRYILPAYVPLTIAAAAATLAMLRHSHKLVRIAALLLMISHAGSSIIAHPDYFPYFNILGGRDPSRYLVDSNVDWGQDVLRLRAALRDEHIDHVSLSLAGPADVDALGFPPHGGASPWTPNQEWVAVSDHMYRMIRAEGGWRWLVGRKYRRIGKSIRLYYIR